MLTKNLDIVQKMLCFLHSWKKKTHHIFKYSQSFPGKQQTLIWLNHFERDIPIGKKLLPLLSFTFNRQTLDNRCERMSSVTVSEER